MEYLSFWKLREPPFESACDAHFFYESKAHGEALARLLYLVSDRGMGMGAMSGEIGSGKTMLLNVLEQRLRKDLYATVRLHTANLTFEPILAEINQQLCGRQELPKNMAKYYLIKEFEALLQQQVGALGKHLILILDEAQFLSKECLDELKCLTNYNQSDPLLTIILSGQPELKETLSTLPQVYQRLGMFCCLKNLQHDEIVSYLQHRLKTAGAEKEDVFAEDCIDPLFSFSGGCPRQINRLCKLAIDHACLTRKERITADMIRVIIRDIEKHFG